MTPRTLMVVGCVADFVIAGGGAVSGAMAQAGSVIMPGPAVWLLGGILGTIALANHVKASYTAPPVAVLLLALAAGWAIGP